MKLFKKFVATSLLMTMGLSGKPADATGWWAWLSGICASILVVDYGVGVCTRLFTEKPRMLHDIVLGK